MFERLDDISRDLLSDVAEFGFVRQHLFEKLEPPKQNVVILKGARGIGKSTLLQQFLLRQQQQQQTVLYISADSSLLDSNLAALAHEYYKRGGQYLAIDEIHKTKQWQIEVKTMLDAFPDLKLLVSGSSSIKLDYAAADLSRRHIMLNAQGLSLREYIAKNYQLNIPSSSLDNLLKNGKELTYAISRQCRKEKIDLLAVFKHYLAEGYFLSRENYPTDNLYYSSLLNSINSVIDADLPDVFYDIDNLSKQKIKFLLKHIATKCPFTPNIAELSRSLDIASDSALKKYLYYLHEGEILLNLYPSNKSHKDFQRPQKIFLNNTNYAYAHSAKPDIGTIRETFVANMLKNQGELTAPPQGDFCLNNQWVFEVGGRSKTDQQIKALKQAYVLADDILTVEDNKIPLWLLGFLW